MVQFGNDWNQVLAGEFDKPYYQQLRSFLKEEYLHATIYPRCMIFLMPLNSRVSKIRK
jgi:uracil DNA glycosylase